MSEATTERRVVIALGSNIHPQRNLLKALEELRREFGAVQVSSIWRTPAVGAPGPDFLNACAATHTALSLTALKFHVLRPLEARLGRVRNTDKNAPRVIDLDVILDDGITLDPDIWTQEHLALPLAELEPALPHPQTGLALEHLASQLQKHALKLKLP